MSSPTLGQDPGGATPGLGVGLQGPQGPQGQFPSKSKSCHGIFKTLPRPPGR